MTTQLKKIGRVASAIALLLLLAGASFEANANSRLDSKGKTVNQHMFATAQYQMMDFSYAKETSSYGVGMYITSISHWDWFHVGADVTLGANAGLVDNWGMLIDFGPSVRADINKKLYVNMPVNATVLCTNDSDDSETSWGMKVAPSLHFFATDMFGIFAGPQLIVPFESDAKASIGMQAGISISF